jgi:hypothetical protein
MGHLRVSDHWSDPTPNQFFLQHGIKTTFRLSFYGGLNSVMVIFIKSC